MTIELNMTNDDDERHAKEERQRAEAASRKAAEKQAQEDRVSGTRGLTGEATMRQLSSSRIDAQRRRKKN
jgi:phage/plasmid primase-like uncharacterized protein